VHTVAPAPTSKGSKIATRTGCVIVYDSIVFFRPESRLIGLVGAT
jgi:hypothetical protein